MQRKTTRCGYPILALMASSCVAMLASALAGEGLSPSPKIPSMLKVGFGHGTGLLSIDARQTPSDNTAETIQSLERLSMSQIPPVGGDSDSQNLAQRSEKMNWEVYTKTNPQYIYRVEYPSDWSVEESGNTSFFIPSHAKSKQESISIIVIDYQKTPPPPVQYTYTTIRTVRVGAEKILVRKREPSPITEQYFAEIKAGGYTAEFRFSLERKYDEVFDHMLSTFEFTTR
jgi:hypothetical protein